MTVMGAQGPWFLNVKYGHGRKIHIVPRAAVRQATYISPARFRTLYGTVDAMIVLPDIGWDHARQMAHCVKRCVCMVRRRPLGTWPTTTL